MEPLLLSLPDHGNPYQGGGHLFALSLGSLPFPVLSLPLSAASECCGHGCNGPKSFGAEGISLFCVFPGGSVVENLPPSAGVWHYMSDP